MLHAATWAAARRQTEAGKAPWLRPNAMEASRRITTVLEQMVKVIVRRRHIPEEEGPHPMSQPTSSIDSTLAVVAPWPPTGQGIEWMTRIEVLRLIIVALGMIMSVGLASVVLNLCVIPP